MDQNQLIRFDPLITVCVRGWELVEASGFDSRHKAIYREIRDA
jgi:hypothetical protein